MYSRRRLGLILGVLVVALVVGFGLRRDRPEAPPVAAPVPAVSEPPPASSTARLAPLRLSPGSVEPGAARPCVRGTVRSLASSAPIPRAEVLFETSSGASATSTDAEGAFEAFLPEGPLHLASITAAGFHPWAPEWGHSPLELTAQPGRCVTGLLFFLAPRVTMIGTVLSLEHEPVAGASVVVHARHRPDSAPIRSNEAGEFEFEAPEDALLVATHPDYLPGRAEVDVVATVTRSLRIVLGPRRAPDAGHEAPRVLRGLVLDAVDAGLPGALVTLAALREPDGGESAGTGEQTTESDERGGFAFTLEEPGRWLLTAEAEGLVPDSRPSSGEPVELHLRGGATLSGTVTDTSGAPVPSFALSVGHLRGAFEVWPPQVRSFVDAAGRFTLRGLEPGRSSVTATAFGLSASEPATQSGAVTSVTLRLRRGAALTGRVVNRDGGVGLEGARVSLEGTQGEGLVPLIAETRSQADGAFTLTGVPPGRHSIFVAASEHDARLLPPRDFQEGQTEGPVLVELTPIPKGQTPKVELQGIGAVLKAVEDALVLLQVVPGGGAAEAGLIPGDGILTIDETPVATLDFAGGIERLRGPENTTVDVTVRRDGAIIHAVVPRRRLVH